MRHRPSGAIGGRAAAVAAAIALCSLSACSSSGGSSKSDAALSTAACSSYRQYGNLSGQTISVFSNIVAPESQQYIDSFKPFEKCTDAKVTFEGSNQFQSQITVRVRSGSAPDIAFVPSVGMIKTLVTETHAVKPAPAQAVKNIEKYFPATFKSLETANSTVYGIPAGSFVKTLIWYSPKFFKQHGLTVPTTWSGLESLSAKISALGVKPWCMGNASGTASGWPTADFYQDILLSMYGGQYYDEWASHKVPTNSAKAVAALNKLGTILKNSSMVNGNLGGVSSIDSATWEDGGLGVAKGTCGLTHMGAFYNTAFPSGTTVSPTGDAWAFQMPSVNSSTGPVVQFDGENAIAFNDSPAVKAFQDYLSTPQFADALVKSGPASRVSANKDVSSSGITDAISKLSVKMLTASNATVRYSADDQMPAAVGAQMFTALNNWVLGESSEAALTSVEKMWSGS